MKNDCTLIYVHDPMCSWCWGFKPVLEQVTEELSSKVNVNYLLGGLAADSDNVMPAKMQTQIRTTWQSIQETIPGTEFNYDFWSQCIPRRSTYPSCRAVIAAAQQAHIHPDIEKQMINAIQQAYYLQAKNPSDYGVLYELAQTINLEIKRFKADIHSRKTQNELENQIALSRSIGANSLPSLFLTKNNIYYPVVLDYSNSEIILEHITACI